MMRRFLLVLLTALVILAGPARGSANDVPPLTGRVVDTAGMLSQHTRVQLDAALEAHERSSTNQIAVLTVPSLQGEAIELYSMRVVEQWRLGTAERDNGVLLLVARDDRELRIEVGYGLEGTLTDAQAGRIIRNVITPHFRNGDFDGGVLNGAMAIVGMLEGSYEPPPGRDGPGGDSLPARLFFAAMFLGIPAMFAFMGVLWSGCGRWGLFLFLMPFMLVGGGVLFNHVLGTCGTWLVYVVAFLAGSFYVDRNPVWIERREKLKKGEAVKIGFMTLSAGASSSGGFSSGGSSFSGGGFSGGGGSFGGGGASGRW